MHVTLVGTPTVAVHPVAVNVPSLAIVVTWRKGSESSFLVQVGKVRRTARMKATISASVLSERGHRLYSFQCLVRLGPLALAARAFPLAVTDEDVCWSSEILNWKPNPPPWPPQTVPQPSMISMCSGSESWPTPYVPDSAAPAKPRKLKVKIANGRHMPKTDTLGNVGLQNQTTSPRT